MAAPNVKIVPLGGRAFLRVGESLVPIDRIRDVEYARVVPGGFNQVVISLDAKEQFRAVGETADALRRYFESL